MGTQVATTSKAKALLVAAGFNIAKFDDLIASRLEREIRSCAPHWACALAGRFAWSWPLRLYGVRVWQSEPDKLRQSLEVAGRSTAFRFTGNVAD